MITSNHLGLNDTTNTSNIVAVINNMYIGGGDFSSYYL